MDSLVIEKTGHLTAGFYAFLRGMQFIYGKPDIAVSTALLNEYAGHYEYNTQLLNKNGSLYFSGNGMEIKMNAETEKSFYVKGVNGIIQFKRDDKGKITGVQFSGADNNMFIKKLD